MIEDQDLLAKFDGLLSDECFSDYLMDDPITEKLSAKGVSGGFLRFRLEKDKLWAETEYDLRHPLEEVDRTALIQYTKGQWSDGIGENFGQACADKLGLFPSIETDQTITEA